MEQVAQLVLERVSVISPLLDEAIAGAILQAATRARGLPHERYPHLRPLSVRTDVREALEAERLPDGWEVSGDPRRMGQLILVDRISGMSLRVLKAPYTQPDRVPYAGPNQARRRMWSQRPLPDLAAQSSLIEKIKLDDQEFLLIWAYNDPDNRGAGYSLRVVHTLVPGAFGKVTACDLDLVIPSGGHIAEDNLKFAGSDADEDLFLFDLPQENESEDELA